MRASWLPPSSTAATRHSVRRAASPLRSSICGATTRSAPIGIGSAPSSASGVAVPFRRDVLWVTLAGGSDLGGDLPADRAFALGGPGSFPGLELGELRVDGYWTVGTSYLWKVKDVLPIRNLALYAGVRAHGRRHLRSHRRWRDGEIYGGSVFLTGRTLVGPLTVGVGTTSTDSWSLWLSVGRPVGHGTILEKGIFR